MLDQPMGRRAAAAYDAAAMGEPQQFELEAAAALPVAEVLSDLGSSDAGLSTLEATRRLSVFGPNALLSHGVSPLSVLVRQLRSYLLLLLLVAAVVSAVVGDRTEALIIGGIMLMSVGLSFLNEYRSELAVEELHSQIRHAGLCRAGRAAGGGERHRDRARRRRAFAPWRCRSRRSARARVP